DRYALSRGFRARFGTSPHRYLVGRRLERVRAEIARGASLADAAYAAGFADQSHMTRHFKARFGLPPARYAALLRAGPQIPEKNQYVLVLAFGGEDGGDSPLC